MHSTQIESWLLITVLAALFYVSVLGQALRLIPGGPKGGQQPSRWWRILAAPIVWDRIGVIPLFMFFSTPPQSNMRLLVRDELCGAEFSPWRTIGFACDQRVKWLWNPDRQRHKAMQDFANALILAIRKQPAFGVPELLANIGFQGLSTYTQGLAACPLVTGRQFLIARCDLIEGRKPPEILFVSPLLAVEV